MTIDRLAAFMELACVPLDDGHATGTLKAAEAMLAAHPELAGGSIQAAAIIGDAAAVRRFLDQDPASATAKSGPRGWDPLTYLCFSRYLRLDRARAYGFVQTAEALLDAGASANSGWFEERHEPQPEWESVLYGAAGVAHHAGLTRLLLARGADPNDGEVTYHAPEGYDNAAMKLLVESGKLTGDSLATMLLRKHDWHDLEGVRFLLEHGADPNRTTQWRRTPFFHAIQRDNALEIIEVSLEHGAEPAIKCGGVSAAELATRRGRGDVLALFERRGLAEEFTGVARLIAACARNDAARIQSITAQEPQMVNELVTEGGKLLAEFAGNGNTDGVRRLLDLGVPIDEVFAEGDGYWNVAKNSTALHVGAWRSRPATVRLLVERGAVIDARDGEERSPLMLAVRACIDSFWTERRSPESVKLLLEAGASLKGVDWPCGYAEVDELLRAAGVEQRATATDDK